MTHRLLAAGFPVVLLSLALALPVFGQADIADALMHGDLSGATRLIEDGADVNATQTDGSTALHWAIYRDDAALTARLIEAGANISAASREGVTPMFMASLYGDEAIIQNLIDAGADANAAGPNGETMLMLASRNGNPAAIHTLIEAGADVNAFEPVRGTTALMWAVEQKNTDAVSVLIEAGADVSAMSARAGTPRPYMSNSVGVATVRRAQERIRREALGLPPLEEEGGGRGGRGGGGRRNFGAFGGGGGGEAGEDAAAGGFGGFGGGGGGGGGFGGFGGQQAGDDADFVEGAEDDGPVAGLSGGDGGGLTPLVFAAREGDLESARLLIEAGADVNQTTYFGWTPLLTAAYNRNYRIGELLIENGADVNMVNMEGMSPLYFATDNRNIEGGDYPVPKPDMEHLEFIRVLLENGADPNHQVEADTLTRTIFTMQWFKEDGATAFIRAGQSSDVDLMELLLEFGADPMARTALGDSALSAAAGVGWVDGVTFERSPAENVEAVRMLLDLGLDPNWNNSDGRTALMGAAFKGNADVVQMLVDAGARLDIRDFGSRDTDKAGSKLEGQTWQPLDYAEGLVRVGVQSAPSHPEVAALMRQLMTDRGIPVPDINRTVDSICIVAICMGEEVDKLLGLSPPEQ